MKKGKYIVVGIALILISTLLIAKWQRSNKIVTTPEMKTVKISYIPATCDLVNFIAYQQGYYKNEGLNVELTKFETSNQVSDALLAGRIDVSGCFAYPVAFSIEANQSDTLRSIRSIITSSEYPFLWLVASAKDQSIKSLKDLSGKKVGRFPGSTTEVQLKHALKSVGVNPNTVSMLAITASQQINALASGAIDALYALEPIPTIAKEQGVGRTVESIEKYLVEPNYNALYAVTNKYYKENKDTVEKVIKAQDRAVDYLRKNPSQAKQVLLSYTPLSTSTALNVGVGYPLRSTEQTDFIKLQAYADLLFNAGDLKIKIDVKKMFVN